MKNINTLSLKFKSNTYAIGYIALIIFAVCNMTLCRLAYGFFGIYSGFISSFLNSVLIIFTIIFLKLSNLNKKRNILLLKLLGLATIIIDPLVISFSQIFSLLEFQGVIFNINNFSIFKDTYIFFNIPLFLIILFISARFKNLANASYQLGSI